jgi:hypothetical protein
MSTDNSATKSDAAISKGVQKSAKPARKASKVKADTKLVAKPSQRPAAKKPEETITSKADLIRKVAGIINAKGEKPRPADIVKILQEEGVTVAPAQVSMTLKAAGYRPLRKRRKEGKTAEARASRHASGASPTGPISLDDLLAAKSVSGAFGSTDKAIAALEALKQLES